jgi:hypothetical protein
VPLAQQDELQYIIKINPDTSAVDKALDRAAKNADGISAGMTRAWGRAMVGAEGGAYPSIAAKVAAGVRQQDNPTFLYRLMHGAGAQPHQQPDLATMLGGVVGAAGGGGTAGAVGGMAGAAVGGPAGALVGRVVGTALAALPKALGDAIAVPAKLATGALEGVASSLRQLQGPLGPVGAGLDLLGGSLQTVSNVVKAIPLVGSLLGPLSDVLAGIPNTLADVTHSLVNMAAAASPGQFRVWQIALEDVQGVIGQRFLPVLDVMRQGVRLFGDVLATFLPTGEEVRAAMGELRAVFAAMANEVRNAAGEMGPSIRGMLVEGIKTLAHWAAVAARTVGILASRLAAFANTRGFGTPGAGAASSVGASAQPAAITSFEEYQRQLQVASFREPGAAASPELGALQDMGISLAEIDQQATALANTLTEWATTALTALNAIKAAAEGIWDFVKATVKETSHAVEQTQTIVQETMNGARGPLGVVGGFGYGVGRAIHRAATEY